MAPAAMAVLMLVVEGVVFAAACGEVPRHVVVVRSGIGWRAAHLRGVCPGVASTAEAGHKALYFVRHGQCRHGGHLPNCIWLAAASMD